MPTTHSTNDLTAPELRDRAAERAQEAHDSFDRCDTDGFLTQWASGLNSNADRMAADLLDAGNVAEFAALYDLATGDRVPARLFDGQYGLCWMIVDATTRKATGTFVSAFPKRTATMERKGYREGAELAPARVVMTGSNVCTVRPAVVRTDDGTGMDAEVVHLDAEPELDTTPPCGDAVRHAYSDGCVAECATWTVPETPRRVRPRRTPAGG